MTSNELHWLLLSARYGWTLVCRHNCTGWLLILPLPIETWIILVGWCRECWTLSLKSSQTQRRWSRSGNTNVHECLPIDLQLRKTRIGLRRPSNRPVIFVVVLCRFTCYNIIIFLYCLLLCRIVSCFRKDGRTIFMTTACTVQGLSFPAAAGLMIRWW